MVKRQKIDAKVEKIIGVVFGVIGLVMLIIGVIIAINRLNFINNAEKVYGTVTDIRYGSPDDDSDSGFTEVTYTYEGEEYVSRVSARSSTISEGDRIDIYVDRENPRKIEVAFFGLIAVYIVGGIGAVFFMIGVAFLLVMGLMGKKKKVLMRDGRKVYAKVTGGSINYCYTVNGRHPFKLECQYTDPYTGAVYLYSSSNTWLDPNIYIGGQVAVYVDKEDFSKYYVDLDSLTEAGDGTGVDVYDYR